MAPSGKVYSRDGRDVRTLAEYRICGGDEWRGEPIGLGPEWQELARAQGISDGWAWLEFSLAWSGGGVIDWRLVAYSPDGTIHPAIRGRAAFGVGSPVAAFIGNEWSVGIEARYTGGGSAPQVSPSYHRAPMPLEGLDADEECCMGGCNVPGDPDAILYENGAGNDQETDRDLLAGNLGPGNCPQVQDRRSGAAPPLFRSGAWTGEVAPADPYDRLGGGFRVYGQNVGGDPLDATHASIATLGPLGVQVVNVASPPVTRVELVTRWLKLRNAAGRMLIDLEDDGNASALAHSCIPADPLNLNRPAMLAGAGSPEGVYGGFRGSLYLRTDTGQVYAKTTGFTTSTGWLDLAAGGATGPARALGYFDAGGNLTGNASLLADQVDSFGRPCLWDRRTGGAGPIYRNGSWQADGDPVNVAGDGVVVIGPDSTGSFSASEAGVGRVKSMRIGLRDSPAAYPAGYDLLKIDQTALLYQRLFGGTPQPVLRVERATGRVNLLATADIHAPRGVTDPNGVISGASGDLVVTDQGVNGPWMKKGFTPSAYVWGGLCGNPGSQGYSVLTMGTQPLASEIVVLDGRQFEFNANTPPAGGSPGMVWVYVGVDAATARANLADAFNGAAFPGGNAVIDWNGQTPVQWAATLNGADIEVESSDVPGGFERRCGGSATTSSTLSALGDGWPTGNTWGGSAPGSRYLSQGFQAVSDPRMATILAPWPVEFAVACRLGMGTPLSVLSISSRKVLFNAVPGDQFFYLLASNPF